eukprot:3829442-Amphidinium_carterae.1
MMGRVGVEVITWKVPKEWFIFNRNKEGPSSHSARALSAGVNHDLSCGDALLDSGASQVILPLEELDEESRKFTKPVGLHLASRSGIDSLIYESEVYAERVRRTFIPLGEMIGQTSSSVLWTANIPSISHQELIKSSTANNKNATIKMISFLWLLWWRCQAICLSA